MLILALDSCGSSCGVCLWQDGRVVAQTREQMERGQDARLMPLVVATLEQAGIDFSALDKIAVTRGPGSFTGLRVGLAAARGIGLACGRPVIGIDRFSAYRALHETGDLLVVLNSKRAELFCRFFPAQGAAHDSCLMTEQEINAFKTSHSACKIAGDLATADDDILAACAKLAAQADAKNPDFLPRPLYLRAPDVTFPSASLSKSR